MWSNNGRSRLKTGLVMDLNNEVMTNSKTGPAINNRTGSKLKSKISFIDAVMDCLEKEETLLEQLIGYGICALTVLYLLGSLARVVF